MVGATGTGKTSLGIHLIQSVGPSYPVLIIDPKPSPSLRSLRAKTLRRPADVATFGGIARVHVASYLRGAYDPWLTAAWARGRLLIVIDELRLLMMHGITDPLVRVLVAGRERGIGCWSFMQRPVKFLEAITEAEWLIAFRLMMEKDRERLEERGIHLDALTNIPDHAFLVHHEAWPEARLHRPIKLRRVSIK